MFVPFGHELNATSQWYPEPTRRGTYSLLSSCLLTLFICVWSAVHLNIPEAGSRSQIGRKFWWMLIAMVAPELVRVHTVLMLVLF
jgi:hypothetical protein